ncbi:hypothetical protein BKA70DRAFT_1425610 [Coprinopsis sp. MPI-PUGE-AT-0042]|nr:hypothetical protein BKA70DRAFT_1425610 [Coprinopsis sp. MPI-PUGE-AT-0042]
MLTIAHGCSCDVCAEEYGPQYLPYSIPCGHVFCEICCKKIIDKTPARYEPTCPFCREKFDASQMRMIRTDFTSSGWSTPRRVPTVESSNGVNSEALAQETARILSGTRGLAPGAQLEVRRLEDKVSKVAMKKCSVEEVSALRKQLEDWLLSQRREEDKPTSLYLSAVLLRAILVNHTAHSEASSKSKNAENSLKLKVAELEHSNDKLESELRRCVPSARLLKFPVGTNLYLASVSTRQRLQCTQKSQECQLLRSEISQLKALATTLGAQPGRFPQSTPFVEEPPSPPSSPSPYSPSQTPVSRFHSRSASMSARPSTPAASPISPSRSHTPAASSPTRTHTPSLSTRSSSASAAAAAHRSYTPAPTPPVPQVPPRYAATPAPMRSHTPAAPLLPPKPRRLSTSTPSPRIARSMSEEKAEAHERWLPPELVADATKSQSRTGFSSSAYVAQRLFEMRGKTPAPR